MKDKIKRILAAALDFFSMAFLSSAFIGALTLGEFTVTPFSIIGYFVIFLLFLLFKDCVFKSASIGKRIFKLTIIKTNGTKLTLGDLIKRNIPLVVLLPVEVLSIIIHNKRIGDAWAKTAVLYAQKGMLGKMIGTQNWLAE